MITYKKGDATSPQAKGRKIIAHVCNDIGGWGRGFVTAISKRWPEPEKAYRAWYRDRSSNDFALGSVQIVPVTEHISVANMVAQRGIKVSRSQGVSIRYGALQQALAQVMAEAQRQNASVHMPRIGCGLAGGRWEEVEPLLHTALVGTEVEVIVYDF